MNPQLLALITALCFGLNPILLKVGFGQGGKVDFAVFLGLIVAIPLYAAMLPFFGGLQWEQVNVTAFIGFVLGGLFGAGIGRGWMYTGIQRIGASRATAIKNSAPLFTTLLAVTVLGELVSPEHWAAILAIIGGLLLLGWKRTVGTVRLDVVGVAASLGAALSYGVRPLFLKVGLEAATLPLTAALVGSIAAAAPYAVGLARRKALFDVQGMRPGFTLFAVAGVLQGFGFLALTFALAEGEVALVYPITATAPLFTLAFSRWLLGDAEHLTRRDVLGILAAVTGVIVLSR